MAKKSGLTASYEALPKLLKILLQLLLGALVGGIYRIVRFFETSNVKTLVIGILALIPPIDLVFWIVDLVTEITNNRITFLVD